MEKKKNFEKLNFIIEQANLDDLSSIQKLNKQLFDYEIEKSFDDNIDSDWSYSEEGEKELRERITAKDSIGLVSKVDGTKESNVISDYESIRKAQINSKARQEVSIRDREAVEIEQDNRQKAEISKAIAEEEFTKRQIEKDKNVGIMAQNKEKEIARQEEEANRQKVEALRTKEVGEADVIKQATNNFPWFNFKYENILWSGNIFNCLYLVCFSCNSIYNQSYKI